MKVTIDRFEGDYAVCEKEDRSMINILRSTIPGDAGEGDILLIESDSITIDNNATDTRKQRIEKMMDDLWK